MIAFKMFFVLNEIIVFCEIVLRRYVVRDILIKLLYLSIHINFLSCKCDDTKSFAYSRIWIEIIFHIYTIFLL